LFFFFIYTHELTAHARFFCRAANVAMLPHDARVRLPILKNRAPTDSMSVMHDGDPRRRSSTSGSGQPLAQLIIC
jgi:hypothetical protein